VGEGPFRDAANREICQQRVQAYNTVMREEYLGPPIGTSFFPDPEDDEILAAFPKQMVEVEEPARTPSGGNVYRPCGKELGGHCPRCGLPLCPEHMPAPDQRCSRCEGDFLGTDSAYYLASIALLAGVAGLFFVFLSVRAGLVLFGLTIASGTAGGLLAARNRRRFLAERPPPGPSATPPPADDR